MPDLQPVFARLRAILEPYALALDTKLDSESALSVDTRHLRSNRQPLHFGAVRLEKRYVSFHLMPVYVDPRLLGGISAGLRRRMQGKSCFNFTRVDEDLFAELAALTRAGYERYADSGYVP